MKGEKDTVRPVSSRRVVLLVLAVLALGAAGYWFVTKIWAEYVRAELAEQNTEQGFIEISVGGVPLRIPIENVDNRRRHYSGNRDSFHLRFQLPDFRPNLQEDGTAIYDNAHPPDSVVVMLNIMRRHGYAGNEKALQIFTKDAINPAGEPGPYGLTLYRMKDETPHHGSKFYAYHFDDGTMLLLRCGSPETSPSPGCNTISYYRMPGLDIYYRYKIQHLKDWRKIHDRLVSLVEGFKSEARQ